MSNREPLTAKRRAAILRYVILTTKKMPLLIFGVDQTLKAERMPAARLYEWLERKGYHWDSKAKSWIERPKKQPPPWLKKPPPMTLERGEVFC